MSDKLKQCRVQFSAAINNACEDSLFPTFDEFQYSFGPQQSWPLYNLGHTGYKRSPSNSSSARINLSRLSFTRKPLSSIENLQHLSQNSVLMEKRAYRGVTENIIHPVPDITTDLLYIIENTSLPDLSELSETLRTADLSDTEFSAEKLSYLLKYGEFSEGDNTKSDILSAEDNRILEMVLDMEEDYKHSRCETITTPRI